MSTYGYSGYLTEMEAPAKNGRTKFYRVYTIKADRDPNDVRYLFHHGINGGTGKYILTYSRGEAYNKIHDKRWGEYTVVQDNVEVSDFTSATLLQKAGINVFGQQKQEQATPVEVSALASFTNSLASLMDTLAGHDLTAEMVVAYRQLEAQFADIKREVEDAEGRMEMLTSLITRKFEGA